MPSRRALIVGIDSYDSAPPLSACAADARAVAKLLNAHHDGTPNYDCITWDDRLEDGAPITRAALRRACDDLFASFRGDVLLFFSGHGVLTGTGGALCTTDAAEDDWGVSMQTIMDMAILSPASDILIMLDCCHSGDVGNPALLGRGPNPLAAIRENMTVIAASMPAQPSVEAGGHGLYTAAVLDALEGGAADHMGSVSASAMYAYVERRFGAWDQRPVYKSHATTVTTIRQCAPLIEREKLRRLIELFPTKDHRLFLDPEYEPEDEHGKVRGPVNHDKVDCAQLLKSYRDAGLVRPSERGEQLFWTARRSHSVELTDRGREYHYLVRGRKI